jgi:hypothetical protein
MCFFAIQEFLLCITVLKERSQVAGTLLLVGKMRCTIEEISDDDTEELRVQSSRFFGNNSTPSYSGSQKASGNVSVKKIIQEENRPLISSPKVDENLVPALDSFAFKPRPRIVIKRPQRPIGLEEDEHQLQEERSLPQSSPEPQSTRKHNVKKRRRRRFAIMDDSDDEDFDPSAETRKQRKVREMPTIGKNTNIFPVAKTVTNCPGSAAVEIETIDLLGDDNGEEACGKNLQDDEFDSKDEFLSQELPGSGHGSVELNPITKTLLKCDKIAASLRNELQVGDSVEDAVHADRYAGVDPSAAKIITQVLLQSQLKDVQILMHFLPVKLLNFLCHDFLSWSSYERYF